MSEIVRLGDVCSKASSNIAQKDLDENEGSYPVYGAAGFIKTVDFYQQEKPYIAVVKDGAGIGRVMKLPGRSSVIGTMQYILPAENVDISYLAYGMEHMNLSRYYSGSAIPHIYFKDYQNEKIKLPPLSEQRHIAAILDKVDSLTALRQQQLDKLDELVKARFVEMFGDPSANPMGWEQMNIGQLMTVDPQNGLYKPQTDYVLDGGTPILRIDAFYEGRVLSFEKLKRLKCSEEEIQRYLLCEDDIVVNRVNSLEYLGKCAHISGMNEPTVYESNMMRFHLDDGRISAVFATHMLCSKFVYHQILKRAKKAVNQASINQGDVKSICMPVPPMNLQNQFAAFVSEVDKLKAVVQKALEKTQLLRASLMQQYFS